VYSPRVSFQMQQCCHFLEDYQLSQQRFLAAATMKTRIRFRNDYQ